MLLLGVWWVSGLEDPEIVLDFFVGELGEIDFEVRFAKNFEIHATSGEDDIGLRGDASLLAKILGDEKLALLVHVSFADQQRELGKQLGLLCGSLFAGVDRSDFVVERFLAEHPDQRHAKILGEHQVKGAARLGTP